MRELTETERAALREAIIANEDKLRLDTRHRDREHTAKDYDRAAEMVRRLILAVPSLADDEWNRRLFTAWGRGQMPAELHDALKAALRTDAPLNLSPKPLREWYDDEVRRRVRGLTREQIARLTDLDRTISKEEDRVILDEVFGVTPAAPGEEKHDA